jgi:CTP synthase
VLLCRSELPIDDDIRSKIALFTNVRQEQVINAYDVPIIYEIPLVFRDANLPEIICRHLKLEQRPLDISQWEDFVNSLKTEDNPVTIAICGQIVEHQTAYKSVAGSRSLPRASSQQSSHVGGCRENLEGRRHPRGAGRVAAISSRRRRRSRLRRARWPIAHYARPRQPPYFGIAWGLQGPSSISRKIRVQV